MSEIARFDVYKKKLQGVCDENDLIFRFLGNEYPITLTIRPAGSLEHQMSMLESPEEINTNPNAAIVFAYVDGVLTYRTSETFTISDALFNKIKNLYKNMVSLWLQFFFREVLEKCLLTEQNFPTAPEEDDGESSDVEVEDDMDGSGDEEDAAGDIASGEDGELQQGSDEVYESEEEETDADKP